MGKEGAEAKDPGVDAYETKLAGGEMHGVAEDEGVVLAKALPSRSNNEDNNNLNCMEGGEGQKAIVKIRRTTAGPMINRRRRRTRRRHSSRKKTYYYISSCRDCDAAC